jgi:glyoxylase-like metal-dependent hydrolase (beta-lactamase superfamily II)/rhodanese-related sulfurtransferase
VANSQIVPDVPSTPSGPLVRLVPLVDEGLGNSAYLVDLGDGRALAIDPSRDLRALRMTVQNSGLTVAFSADTHLHADFLSGSLDLATADGTTVLASAAGRREFPHIGLRDGDEIDLGRLTLRALVTPGHTDEHLAFLLLDGQTPVGVFSGGSLLVGAAARTDLVDPARTEELARAQYRSVQRLLNLPDHTALWPTHGAGSFCSAPPGAQRTSTIGAERATNPLLRAADEDEFVNALLSSLGTYPTYFARLGEVNRLGPAPLRSAPKLAPVSPYALHQLLSDGAVVIDVRPVEAFAAAHLTGSLSIPLRDAFATWLGWVAPHDVPLVVVRDHEQDPDEVAWQAAKVGYDTILGELAGGLAAATTAGLRVSSTRLVQPAAVSGAELLDIRQKPEFDAGHVPGANHVELGALPAHASGVPAEARVVMCGHGERAMTAASLLARAGRDDIAVLRGSPDDWANTHQTRLESGV